MAYLNSSPSAADEYDVAIIGGALAGAATAIQILDTRPTLRILIIERSEVFDRRVGEATIELSTYFLTRVLGLGQHLNEHHYAKQGLRFWFANEHARNLSECSEIGGKYLARLPAYLVDRATLDTEALRLAVEKGALLWRPATVKSVKLVSGGHQEIEVQQGDVTQRIRARWLVDASGVTAFLARHEGWHHVNEAHPTAAAWARWRGVEDWDSPKLAKKYPAWAAATFGLRNTATNHFMGNGWWAWWIPLKGGDVSIGLVWDQRRIEMPGGASVAERIKQFLLLRHPVAAEMMADASAVEGDVHWRRNLPYFSTTMAGDGFALVGDASGFLDPFYSPGLDWLGFTTARAAHLICEHRTGSPDTALLVANYNRDFTLSYHRWFHALYLNKYDYLGDFELMRIAFLLDLGLYYLGIVTQPYFRGREAMLEPYFATPPATPFYHFMAFYARRLAAMGRERRTRGVFGKRNANRRFMFGGFSLKPTAVIPIVKALCSWSWLELTEGWRTWKKHSTASKPASEPPAPAVAKESQAEVNLPAS